MSDLDSEDSQCWGRLDLESNIPHYSLVDSTIDLTPVTGREDSVHDTTHRYGPPFNTTTCFSADRDYKDWAQSTGDSNISGPAPNTSMSVCYAPPIETRPSKGEEFLESLILTTPQMNPRYPFQFQCGGIEVEGAKNSTYI